MPTAFGYLVTTAADDGATTANAATSGSLRQGILNAEAAGGGVIALAPTLGGSINVTGGLPAITDAITIDGTHSGISSISSSSPVTISAGASLDLILNSSSFNELGGSAPVVDGTLTGPHLSTIFLDGSGTVTTSPSSVLQIATGTIQFTFAGSITTGSLVEQGSGSQILTGNISTSSFTIDGGSLDIHSATVAGTPSVFFGSISAPIQFGILRADANQLNHSIVSGFGNGTFLDLIDVPSGSETAFYDTLSGSLELMSGSTVVETMTLTETGMAPGALHIQDDGAGGTLVSETAGFTVTSTSDDSSTVADGASSGSLRQGILNIEAAGGGLIATPVATLALISALPVITDAVTIDGSHFSFQTFASGTTTIASGASLDLEGGAANFLGAIQDDGLLTSKASFLETENLSGSGTVQSGSLEIEALLNTTFSGTISLLGELVINGSGTQILTGQVTAPTIEIEDGTLDVQGAALSGAPTFRFDHSTAMATSTLVATSGQMAGRTIAGFGPGDTLDLVDFNFGDAIAYDTISGGLLFESGPFAGVTIFFNDTTLSPSFLVMSSDGANGTKFTEAASFAVATTGDDGTTTADGTTSGNLRQAILNLDADGGGLIAVETNFIPLNPTSSLPTITQHITIDGSHSTLPEINAVGTTSISAGASLDLEDVFFATSATGSLAIDGTITSSSGLTLQPISGSGTIRSDFVATGKFSTATSTFSGSVLPFTGTVGGTFEKVGIDTEILTGHVGSTFIEMAGGTLDIHSATLDGSPSFSFVNQGSTATLIADASQLNLKTLNGFGNGTVLDLRDVPFGTEMVIYDSGSNSLQVLSGAPLLDTISLANSTIYGNFVVTSDDGAGGTQITELFAPATTGNSNQFTVTGGAASIIGTSGNDTIAAAAGVLNSLTSIDGGAGNNTLQLAGAGSFDLTQPAVLTNIQTIIMTNAGPNVVTLRAGLDVAFGASNLGDTVTGGNAHDTIFGGTGADSLTATASGNWLIGNGGADTLTGSGPGGDTLLGGIGNDRLVSGSTGTAGNILIGKEGANTGDDTLIGGSGHDTLVGHNGNDSIVGGNGGNFLIGGYPGSMGNPTLQGGTGDDTIVAAPGDSSLSAGGGNDFLVGEGGNDTIVAGAGSDTIFGHGGLGGSDANVYVVASGETVLIADFANTDRIDVSAYHFANFTALQAAATVTVADNGVILTLPSGLNLSIVGETTIHSSDFIL